MTRCADSASADSAVSASGGRPGGEPDRAESLVRVTELEDQIAALTEKHRRHRAGLLLLPVMLAGLVVGALVRASEWIWYVVGGFVSLPVVL